MKQVFLTKEQPALKNISRNKDVKLDFFYKTHIFRGVSSFTVFHQRWLWSTGHIIIKGFAINHQKKIFLKPLKLVSNIKLGEKGWTHVFNKVKDIKVALRGIFNLEPFSRSDFHRICGIWNLI